MRVVSKKRGRSAGFGLVGLRVDFGVYGWTLATKVLAVKLNNEVRVHFERNLIRSWQRNALD